MKNKGLRIGAGAVALLLIGGIMFVTNAMTGNPVSAYIANKAINAYVEENYSFLPDLDYKETNAFYNFKDGRYGKYVQSKSSQDTAFRVIYSGKNECTDEYDSYVEGRFNTWTRLGREFDDEIERILAEQFPYETDMILADIDSEDEMERKENLELDMALDIHNLPLTGILTVYILSEDVSKEFLSQRILELVAIMEQNGISIDKYSVTVREPEGEDGMRSDGIYTYDIPFDEIKGKTAEQLLPVIEENIRKTEEEDKMKLEVEKGV